MRRTLAAYSLSFVAHLACFATAWGAIYLLKEFQSDAEALTGRKGQTRIEIQASIARVAPRPTAQSPLKVVLEQAVTPLAEIRPVDTPPLRRPPQLTATDRLPTALPDLLRARETTPSEFRPPEQTAEAPPSPVVSRPPRDVPQVEIEHEPVEAASTSQLAQQAESGGEYESAYPESNNAKPPYPPDALARRQHGLVTVRFKITDTGVVESVSLLQSSGIDSLDRAALDTMQTWRFRPAKRDGRNTESYARLSFRFIYPY